MAAVLRFSSATPRPPLFRVLSPWVPAQGTHLGLAEPDANTSAWIDFRVYFLATL
jgi:hypothetical protein